MLLRYPSTGAEQSELSHDGCASAVHRGAMGNHSAPLCSSPSPSRSAEATEEAGRHHRALAAAAAAVAAAAAAVHMGFHVTRNRGGLLL
jgi:hypothetical protein